MELGLSSHMHLMALEEMAPSGNIAQGEAEMPQVEDSPAEVIFGNAITGGLVLENLPVLERIALRGVSSGFRDAVSRTCEDVHTLAVGARELHAVLARISLTKGMVENSGQRSQIGSVRSVLTEIDSKLLKTLGTVIGQAIRCALRACHRLEHLSLHAECVEPLKNLAEVALVTAFRGACQENDNDGAKEDSGPLSTPDAAPLGASSARSASSVSGRQFHAFPPPPARFPSLTRVDLPNSSVTSASIAALSSACPSLTHLDLTGCIQVDDRAVATLARHAPCLAFLSLSTCHAVTDEAIATLAPRCPSLATLLLRGCRRVTDRALAALGAHSRKLVSLDVADCRSVTDAGISTLAKGCPLLAEIDLEMCGWVSDAGIMALLRPPSGSDQDSAGVGGEGGGSSGVGSNGGDNVSVADPRPVTAGSETSAPGHRGVDAGAGSSTRHGRTAGGDPGSHNSSNDDDNRGMGGRGGMADAGAGASNQGAVGSSGQTTVADGGRYRVLRRVGLFACAKVTDEGGMRWLADAAGHLEEFNAGKTDVSDATLALLAHRAGDRLRTLTLRTCVAVTDLGLCTLALECPGLTHVDIGGCSSLVTDAFLRLLAERCRQLRHLSMWGCLSVTDAGVNALASSECRDQLRYFHCGGCAGVTKASLVPLVRACPQLVEVQAFCCPGVSEIQIAGMLWERQARARMDLDRGA